MLELPREGKCLSARNTATTDPKTTSSPTWPHSVPVFDASPMRGKTTVQTQNPSGPKHLEGARHSGAPVDGGVPLGVHLGEGARVLINGGFLPF